MAISDFGSLKTAVALWLNRADLAASIPDFIQFAATRIYYGSDDPVLPSAPVRTWSMQTVTTNTVASTIALPTRYLSTILIQGDQGNSGQTIDYVSPSQFTRYANSQQVAERYTILNNSIYLGGTGAQTLTHHYYQSFADFSADADTNALLLAAPSLWLYAALVEAYVFVEADEPTKKYHRLFSGVVTGLNRVAEEHGGGTLAVRTR